MSEIVITSTAREEIGKGAARALRRDGFVPAIIYGGQGNPEHVSVIQKDLNKLLQSEAFFTHVYTLDTKTKKNKVLAREVQFHPVTDQPLHIDFLRVTDKTEIVVSVPVHFTNELESPGLKRGGVLNVVRHELELRCKAANIPGHIVVDLTGYEIGDSIHFSNIQLPGNVSSVLTHDFTVATVTAPSALRGKDDDDDEDGITGEDSVAEEEADEEKKDSEQ